MKLRQLFPCIFALLFGAVLLLEAAAVPQPGAGVLPYSFSRKGNRIYLLGYNPHKNAWCDFGGAMEWKDGGNVMATAIREFNEETIDFFSRYKLSDPSLYLQKTQPRYTMYFQKVPYIDSRTMTNKRACLGPQAWRQGAEPTRFGWIRETELMDAINYAHHNNTSYGIIATHFDSSGKQWQWPLDPAFVGMLRNGESIWSPWSSLGIWSLLPYLK